MVNTKLSNKLDALLRMYHSKSTTDGEKNNALALFKKLCSKHNINPEQYMKNKNIPKASHNSSTDADIFWQVFYEYMNNAKKDDETKKAYEYRKRYSPFTEQKQEPKKEENRWNNNKWGTLEFEMKEPLFEVKNVNGKRVILINSLVRSNGAQDRWGTQNFCIYSEAFEPDESFSKDSIFMVKCSKVQYFRDHYLIKELYIVDEDGFEHEIDIR